MGELLTRVASIAVLVFTVTSMLSVGLSYNWRELLEPLRNVGGVTRTLVSNFVLVPLLAFVVVKVFALPESYSLGLFLVASAAGAAFLIKLVEVSRGDVALAASLLVLLIPMSVIFIAYMVPILLPGITVSAWAIGSPLLWTLLLPLGVGLAVDSRWPRLAGRLRPVMQHASSIALGVLLVALTLTNLAGIADVFISGAMWAVLLVLIGAFGIGYAMGGTRPEVRRVVGFATAQRNYGAAMVVATQAFGDQQALIMVVVTSLVGMVLFLPIAWHLRRRMEKRDEIKSSAPGPIRTYPETAGSGGFHSPRRPTEA